jgi:alpha-beta hydrolase superfamily lysophospholipase
MLKLSSRQKLFVVLGIVPLAGFVLAMQLPPMAAGALLHPARHHVAPGAPENCQDAVFVSEGITLKGWRCHAATPKRGTIIYLHGVGDNRVSSAGVIQRFVNRGFDVVAYDSRAHGESGGESCTYGYFEKSDLHRVIDTLSNDRVILIGSSMGAAVALQEMADDPRVVGAVAAESFSDLRTVATERAPFFLTDSTIRKAFNLAEQQAGFSIDAVNVVEAARRIAVPVLLIHGDMDRDTPPEHSQRIFSVLHSPKRLILVPGAKHNESLKGTVWPEIERWIDSEAIR